MRIKFKGDDGTTLVLTDTTISSKGETHSLAGVHAHIEDGSAVGSRVTATRLLLLGVFALAAKKRTGGEKYLIVEGDDFAYAAMVKQEHIGRAIRFKTRVMDAAAKCRSMPDSAVKESETGTVCPSWLRRLQKLKDSLA